MNRLAAQVRIRRRALQSTRFFETDTLAKARETVLCHEKTSNPLERHVAIARPSYVRVVFDNPEVHVVQAMGKGQEPAYHRSIRQIGRVFFPDLSREKQVDAFASGLPDHRKTEPKIEGARPSIRVVLLHPQSATCRYGLKSCRGMGIAMSVFSTVRGKERVRVPSSPNERHAKFPSGDR